MGSKLEPNNKNISRAIKKATGYDVKLHKCDGCVHFYSDDDDTGLMLALFNSTTFYVNSIKSYSVDQWVENFKGLLADNADEIETHKNNANKEQTTIIKLSSRKG